MELQNLSGRCQPPLPWDEGEKIPWNDPEFSKRMLQEHLKQSHDLASRRFAKIDGHVKWIREVATLGEDSKVLDLGCGPGFYTSRLAKCGCSCVGIDFSLASVQYAEEEASREETNCTYLCDDLRTAQFGDGFDLVLFIFGEFNVFTKEDASLILSKCWRSLKKGGSLILEVNPYQSFQKTARQSSWFSTNEGLFSDQPHLCLLETYWSDETKTATSRHFVIDSRSGQVERISSTTQAYTDEDYRQILEVNRFEDIVFHPSLLGPSDQVQKDLFVILAKK